MHHMVLCAFGIGFYINILAVDAFAALAVEGSLDGSFGARSYGLFGGLGSSTAATGANTANDKRFIAGIFKTERYIQLLSFGDLAIVLSRVNPLNSSEFA